MTHHIPRQIRAILLIVALLSFTVLPCFSFEITKVIPQFKDQKGRVALSPSLFERDAYQASLRRDPTKTSGMIFRVHVRRLGASKQSNLPPPELLRLEVRGKDTTKAATTVDLKLAPEVAKRNWHFINLGRADFEKLGSVTAWRVSLWREGKLISSQTSFLW